MTTGNSMLIEKFTHVKKKIVFITISYKDRALIQQINFLTKTKWQSQDQSFVDTTKRIFSAPKSLYCHHNNVFFLEFCLHNKKDYRFYQNMFD